MVKVRAQERRQQQKEERHSGIVEAAERVFSARGMGYTTMDQIAREAGVSKGTLYLYFKNKDEIFLTMSVDAISELRARLALVRQHCEEKSGCDWFRGNLAEVSAYAMAHPDRFHLALGTGSADYRLSAEGELFDTYQDGISSLYAFGAEALMKGQADGSLRSDLEMATTLFQSWSSLVGVLDSVRRMDEIQNRMPMDLDLSRLLEAHLDVLMRGLRSDRSASERAGGEPSSARVVGLAPGKH